MMELPLERIIPLLLAFVVAALVVQGLTVATRDLPKSTLGILGFLCFPGFFGTIALIVLTEPPFSTTITPLKVLALIWVAAGNEFFKRSEPDV
ncbi:hypothetical protein AB3R30_26230 [Leptolyngbyaceae cyanobacterium UHCC 1019]